MLKVDLICDELQLAAGNNNKKTPLCLTQAPTLMADAQQLLIGLESRGNEPCFWNGCYCVSSLGAVPLCVSFPAETLADLIQVHKHGAQKRTFLKQTHYTSCTFMTVFEDFPQPVEL